MFGCCLLGACSFLKGSGEGVCLNKREVEGSGKSRGGIVVGMHWMREESIFINT